MKTQHYAPAIDGSHHNIIDGARTADPFGTAVVGDQTYYGSVWADRRGATFVVLGNVRKDVRYVVARGKWVHGN